MPVPRVGDDMSVDGPDNAVLTAAQEKEIVRELTEAAEGQVREGDTFYLISYRWWRLWLDYVDPTDLSSSEGGEALTTFTPGSFGPFSKRPSSIENSDLVLDAPSSEDKKSEPDLKENLIEDRDYILLPEQVWMAFHKWYGGGPALPRKVITMGYGSHEDLAVEVYPLQVNLIVQPPGTKAVLRFSKKDTIGKLQQTVCEHFKLELENVRIWDYFNKQKNKQLTEPSKSLQEAYIHMNQEILVEVRRNGKWPDSSISSTGKSTVSSSSSISNGSNGSSAGREMTVLSESRSIANGPPASKPGTRNGTNSGYPTYSMDKEKESDGWLGSSSGAARAGPKGVTGLQNLGNTCFMNSALQCLVHTPPLATYFLQDYTPEINRHNPLGMEGELAIAFGELLRKLWAPGKQPVPPRQFKTKLARFAPQFSGYNQHDSQELLAFLLDGLHEDLNRVKNKPYVEAKDADGRPDKEVATEYWANHRSRNDSIIVDVCQGQYKSTLVCPTCSKVSVTFDPFMYLSLPLPAKTTRTMTVTVFSGDGSAPPTSYTVTVSRQGRYKDLIQAIGIACNLGSEERLILAELYNHRIFRVLDEPLEWLTAIRDDDRIGAYRLPKTSEKGTLLCLLHRRLESDTYTPKNAPQWKLFSAPLVTSLPEEAPTGADVVKIVKKLLTPMERSDRPLPAESMDLEGERTVDNAPEEDVDMVEGGDFARSETSALCGNNGNGEQVQSDSLDVTQKQPESSFQLWITDDKGTTREGSILMDKQMPPAANSARATAKVRYVAVDWSAAALEQEYDMSKVDMPPEVLRTGLPATSKKARQEAVSLYTCLEAFLKEEPLGPEDMWYCPRCKEHRQASKKLDLWRLPEILVVHLKRFSYSRYLKNKLETFVNFPVDDLDLSKYVASTSESQGHVYELYAVSNHYGSMGGGHYTAYVKLVDENKWYNFDDSHVSPVNESDIKTSAAYVLFYRRIRSEESSLRTAEAHSVVTSVGSNQKDVADVVDADMTGASSHFLPP
ncbi:hypothetical protein MPTK1_3g14190 [Marchantia polymorpha subsp. ruderalis]|uniref:ubiquitinyl hydrolase 1 n=2 Tax=Marchantia polymorpha TaxID=3197 RepID=A0A176WDZ8_MARPO|nr:hypothetical protein AXG93_3128s1050 [Marchantia polymorpha subsp. ruderalis]PTQ49019.1 hypothetical protein MARPO_0004s0252 [Marchantia polymorpha]BBN05563.1 hypothetical protein Mp_3g14190 [Marchantia polymorpha subsp. ruderalis]|eukprot:PTQ49019.1 hypothetical protein MARPO_0004s0252 [Marchantia polymorpha]